MDAIRLRPGISYCRFPGRAIVLDVDRDRYWQVSDRVGAALDRVARGDGTRLEPEDVAMLEDLGLVERAQGDASAAPAADIASPATSATEQEVIGGRFQLAEALEVAHLSIAARRLVRRLPLRTLLDGVMRSRSLGRGSEETDVILVAQHFHRYRRLVPLPPLCLPDTIAFLRFAGRRGCSPHLVFGVEAWPFAAHCWAQAGDCALNDALDHVRSFSPILVL
ncbi:MAG: lasso peptide biosynthesis B2 protein [Sphingopyxis sp.]|nr:lasso peptide biosynthesis B2 protein [Sphingopyxis sp.]